ncbi:MAG: hypothetical protein LBE76_08675 [Nitrososphaerota archaeon]|jgi:hypothetical protein|nr:hypothetical protein [Nitrososphaerota archaeon]
MPKKDFRGTVKGADKLFSVNDIRLDTSSVQDTLDTQRKRGFYRLNLKLDIDLRDYISDAAWRQRTNITGYLNNLIRADQNKHNKGAGL